MSLFDDAVQEILRLEGGYTNDPADPGGETHWGISKASYPDLDIKTLTREAAIELYRTDFWDRVNGDQLPGQIAVVTFDAAVNQGVGWAKRTLQMEVGTAADGIIGPETLAAVRRHPQQDLARALLVRRGLHYVETLGWQRFGKGWLDRLFQLQAFIVHY